MVFAGIAAGMKLGAGLVISYAAAEELNVPTHVQNGIRFGKGVLVQCCEGVRTLHALGQDQTPDPVAGDPRK